MRGYRALIAGLGLALMGAFQAAMAEPVQDRPKTRDLVVLSGNTRPEARTPLFDRGAVADALPMEHMLLSLRRPADREAALDRYIDELTDPGSPHYHQWLTAEQLGRQFGPSRADLAKVRQFLSSHGFTVNTIYPSGVTIDFSGTAGQVRGAFQTEIHNLDVHGEAHIANISDPKIPASLAGLVAGIVSLNDFKPKPASHKGPAFEYNNCGEGLVTNCNFVTPTDLATIYNFNPEFDAGITGKGETITVVEDSDIYSAKDWTIFRSLFGLSKYTSGSLIQSHPAPTGGGSNCADPGTNSDDFEATLDVEYASAAAPDATVTVASCQSTNPTWGVLIAIQNVVNAKKPPSVLSISYVWCETYTGTANNAFYKSTYQQAVAEGTSVFVAAGDWGAATCDLRSNDATDGVTVNGMASTIYNVAVGGTDFGDVLAKTSATYWNPTNGATYGNAISYVPEIPWNNTCASPLTATYLDFAVSYGSGGLCNSKTAKNDGLQSLISGGGGPSACATGSPSGNSGVVGGTCKGTAKPSWQKVYGNPSDGVRDLPDVSLFSAGALWGHAYIVCLSDPNENFNAPCSKFPDYWVWGYGTSFASPIMGGIQALINQATKSKQGNPAPTLYHLARSEYGSKGASECLAKLGNKTAKSCVFHDITQGSTDAPCAAKSANCYAPSGALGVLSRSTTKYDPVFPATAGWDFATGLGSVDVANLVKAWPR